MADQTAAQARQSASQPRQYIQFISAAPPAWQHGGPTRLAHSYLSIARTGFDRAAIATVAQRAGYGHVIASATGLDPADVLLTYAPTRKLALSFASPFFWTKVLSLLTGSQRTVLHLLEFKGTLTLRALALRYAFRRKSRLVHSAFGHLSTLNANGFFIAMLCRLYFKAVDLVLCQSPEEAQRVQELGARFGRADVPTYILPLAVLDAPTRFAHTPNGPTRPGPVSKAIFLGRVVPEKGVLESIAQVRGLTALTGLTEISLFGPRQAPEYEDAIAAACRDAESRGLRCHRAEVGDPASRFALYEQADVFVMLPTVKEESSLATIEALITGCKLLLNENCVIPHWERLPSLVMLLTARTLPAEVAAWLAKPGTAADLALARQLFVERGRSDFLKALDMP